MTSENSVPVPSLTLNDEREIPQIGLGTYKLRDEECISVVREAIDRLLKENMPLLHMGKE